MNGIQVRYYDKYDLTGRFTMLRGRRLYRYQGQVSLQDAKSSRTYEFLKSTLHSSQTTGHNFQQVGPMVSREVISQYYGEESLMIHHRYVEGHISRKDKRASGHHR